MAQTFAVIAVLQFFVQYAVCQQSPTACGNYPGAPANSEIKCFTTSCIVTCLGENRFVNGARTMMITCRNNNWLPSTGGFTSIPDCLAPCNPPCVNGQKCFQPQRECHCPDGFRGPLCNEIVTCPMDQKHKGCADSCKVTCRARASGSNCTNTCAPDYCVCGEGFAKDDKGQCWPVANCPCYVQGAEYTVGHHMFETANGEFEQCTCSDQQWSCKPLRKGFAQIYGEHENLMLVDGTIVRNEGNCSYYLLRSQDFSIIFETENTKVKNITDETKIGKTTSRSLKINLPDIILRLMSNKTVVVNAEVVDSLPFQRSGLKIWHASSEYLLAQLPNGLELQWDGQNTANVHIPQTLFGKAEGLLGAYNGNTGLFTSDGQQTTSVSTFINSWRVDQEEQCDVAAPIKTRARSKSSGRCTFSDLGVPVTFPPEIHEFCNKINGPSFEACIQQGESDLAEEYYKSCLVDACNCRYSDFMSCSSCDQIKSFASICCNIYEHNTSMSDVPECIETCPSDQIYSTCGSSCKRTCRIVAAHPTCNTENVAGCNCPKGQSLDKLGKCVQTSKCFCIYNETEYESDTTVVRPLGEVYAEKCTCQKGTWTSCTKLHPVNCSSYGDPFYRTFDGKLYDFQGLSSYILVQHKDFIIEALNKPFPGGSAISILTIRISGLKIQLMQNKLVSVDGKLVKLPWERTGVISITKPNNIQAIFEYGINIYWDGVHMLDIMLPAIFYGTVKGLCGNFNLNESDDFEMPSGSLANSEIEFGNSWVVDKSAPPLLVHPHPCNKSEQMADFADNECSAVGHSVFQNCSQHIDAELYYESCRFDVCATENSASACAHLAAYDRECTKLGLRIPWRKYALQCYITCPSNQIYQLCRDTCQMTCSDLTNNRKCSISECAEGCSCPPGEVWHDQKNICINQNECPCTYNGKSYRYTQESIQNNTKGGVDKCRCIGGTWQCKTLVEAKCYGYGDPHYHTFDGLEYDMHGACKYYLLWHFDFTITGKNYRCGTDVSCMESFTVKWPGFEIQLLKNRKVLVNDIDVTIPTYEYLYNVLSLGGPYFAVSLWNGVSIVWNGATSGYQYFEIVVPPTFYGKTEGLCGTFNANFHDDFRTSLGSYTNSSIIFADSWVDGVCNKTVDNPHPCILNPSMVSEADRKCSYLQGGILADCYEVVPVEVYYESCRYDLCAGGQDEDMCAAISAYATECAAKGVVIDWRKSVVECRLPCNSGLVHQICGSSCRRTCKDIASNVPCTERCAEGCGCPDGAVLDNNNKCIQTFKCPCEYVGKEYQSEDKIVKYNENNKDEIDVCACVSGQWSCRKQNGARCSVVNDVHFLTFDQITYDFTGVCGYILLQKANTTVQSMARTCSDLQPNKCSSGITIRYGIVTVSLQKENKIDVNGMQPIQFPYALMGVTIHKASSIFFVVTLPDGVQVYWDGSNRTYIDVQANFYESTEGLCGNFNADKSDEFTTSLGTVVSDVYEYANSWKVYPSCKDAANLTTPCESNEVTKQAAIDHCSELRGEGFKACHGTISVEPYIEKCMYDVCACEGEQGCRCTVMSVYADECAAKGIYVNWRQKTNCGGSCPAGQEFQACSSCELTCRDLQRNVPCNSRCVEGCSCPVGRIMNDEGICILLEECPCMYDGKEYSQGESVIQQNGDKYQLCKCGEGRWNCRDQPPGECMINDNSNVTTFSGLKFNMRSECSYYLFRYDDISVISSPSVCVEENGSTICSSSITVEYGTTTVQLNKAKKIVCNGHEITLPYEQEDVSIRMISSVFAIVQLANGVDVYWDGESRISIHVLPTFFGKTRGLCGSFNESSSEDMFTRWGQATDNMEEIAISWQQMSQKCQFRKKTKADCNTDEARIKCDPLRNITGYICGDVVDVEPYYWSCVKAVCDNRATSHLCSIFASYADECASNGRVFDWRSRVETCAIDCPDIQVYERCIDTSARTCYDIATSTKKSATCLEGCVCPKGFSLNSADVCVPLESCGCIEDGIEHAAGSNISRTNGVDLEKCTCVAGKWQCLKVDGARCTYLGQDHYTTFDGSIYNFIGQCRYYLTRTPHFMVEAELRECDENKEITGISKATCQKTVTVRSGTLSIELKENNEIMMDSQIITEFPITKQGVTIRRGNLNTIIVSLYNGAEVWWDDSGTLRIDVPSAYFGKTEGLCGSFNGNSSDDMTTSWGVVSATLDTFVQSWKVQHTCNDDLRVTVPCDPKSQIGQTADKTCSFINGTAFDGCHSLVDVDASYKACMIDMCHLNQEPYMACSAISDYVSKCVSKGAGIPLASTLPICKKECPSGLTFRVCGDSCAMTCRDISLNPTCQSKCVEGCSCPAGFSLDQSNKCIPISECGCVHNDVYYGKGEQIIRSTPGTRNHELEISICDSGRWISEAATALTPELKSR